MALTHAPRLSRASARTVVLLVVAAVALGVALVYALGTGAPAATPTAPAVVNGTGPAPGADGYVRDSRTERPHGRLPLMG
jgi:hypothetical protein